MESETAKSRDKIKLSGPVQELVTFLASTCHSGAAASVDQGAVREALTTLSKHKFDAEELSCLQHDGFAGCLVRLFDPGWEVATSAAAVSLAFALCRSKDASLRDALAREGIQRKLLHLLDSRQPVVCAQAIAVLQRLVNAPTEQHRVVEDLFKSGGFGKITRLLDPAHDVSPVVAWACVCLQSTSNINSSSIRERLRDLGVIDVLITMARTNPRAEPAFHSRVSALYNLTRSEALHTSFKESGFLQLVSELMSAPLLSKTHTVCVIAVAHVYGGDDGSGTGPADEGTAAALALASQILNAADPSRQLYEMAEAVVHGAGLYMGSDWSLEEVLHGVQSLARSPKHAQALVQVSFHTLLVAALTDPQGRWSSDTDVHLKACRAALNLASHEPLVQPLLEAGLGRALLPYQNHSDMRVSDASRGCLLALKQLQDVRAVVAAAHTAAATETVVAAAWGGLGGGGGDEGAGASAGAIGGAPDDGGRSGGGGGGPGGGPEGGASPAHFDVFLSHKRSDAKDFARALYNLLVLRGITTFLDFEFREELSDLGTIVSRCRNLVFILTDNIFESPWCMLELATAIRNNINIVLVVKEGSRWKNSEGLKVCEFPPYEMINALPETVRSVFSRKAITHSDEYYQAFVELLLSKLKRAADGGAGGDGHGRKDPPHPGAPPAPREPYSHVPPSSPPVAATAAVLPAAPQNGFYHPPANPHLGATNPQLLEHSQHAHPQQHQQQLPSLSHPQQHPPQLQQQPPPHHLQQEEHPPDHASWPASAPTGAFTVAGGPPAVVVEAGGATTGAAHVTGSSPVQIQDRIPPGNHAEAHAGSSGDGQAAMTTRGGSAAGHVVLSSAASAPPHPAPGPAMTPPWAPGTATWPGPGGAAAPGPYPYPYLHHPWMPWPNAGLPVALLQAQQPVATASGLPASGDGGPFAALGGSGSPYPALSGTASSAAAAAAANVAAAMSGTAATMDALQSEMHQLRRDLGALHRDLYRASHDTATVAARDVAELRRELAAFSRDTSHSLQDLTAAVGALGLQLQRLTVAGAGAPVPAAVFSGSVAAAQHRATMEPPLTAWQVGGPSYGTTYMPVGPCNGGGGGGRNGLEAGSVGGPEDMRSAEAPPLPSGRLPPQVAYAGRYDSTALAGLGTSGMGFAGEAPLAVTSVVVGRQMAPPTARLAHRSGGEAPLVGGILGGTGFSGGYGGGAASHLPRLAGARPAGAQLRNAPGRPAGRNRQEHSA